MFPKEMTAGFVPSSSPVEFKRTIPIQWMHLSQETVPDFEQFDKVMTANQKGPSLSHADLQTLGPNLFKGNDVLEKTLEHLTGDTKAQLVRGCEIQGGLKAYILMWEAQVDNASHYFVTYLSRGPEGTPLAVETLTDFANLKYLSGQFEHHLKPEGKARYGVINPIAYGTAPFKGEQYHFFSMPFAEGYGELHVTTGGESENSALTTWYRYAFSPTESMLEESFYQAQKGPIAYTKKLGQILLKSLGTEVDISNLHNLVRQGGDLYARKIVEAIHKMPEEYVFQRLKRQHFDVLVGNMLVYLLSGNRFPRQFGINNGDWMVQFLKDAVPIDITDPQTHKNRRLFPNISEALKLQLITVRGGFSQPIDIGDFATLMHRQVEVRSFNDIREQRKGASSETYEFQPFAQFDGYDFANVYEYTKSLLV